MSVPRFFCAGQIAMLTDLKCTQDTNVQMTSAHHGKTVSMVKKRSTLKQGDRLLTRVDQVEIFLTSLRGRPHAKDAVFALKNDFTIFGNEVGHECGLPNS